MSTKTIKLTGWKALIVIVAIGAFAAIKYSAGRETLPTEGADELKLWISAEYVRAGLPALEEAIESGNREAVEAQTQDVLAGNRIVFRSIKARGSSSDMVVRVEIAVDGGPPPVGDAVRYFAMEYSMITGWRMHHETTALAYYLEFF